MSSQPQTKVSPTPKARPKKEGIDRRPDAEKLYRALQRAGGNGLAWRECLDFVEEPGSVVTWLRSKGVGVEAGYDPTIGETRFTLFVVVKEGEDIAPEVE